MFINNWSSENGGAMFSLGWTFLNLQIFTIGLAESFNFALSLSGFNQPIYAPERDVDFEPDNRAKRIRSKTRMSSIRRKFR